MQLASPGRGLNALWRLLAPLPGGGWLLGRILGLVAPYTGTISPLVRELRPGYSRIQLRDTHGVRNHLDSVHAVALVNLVEVSSGLAMLNGLAPGVRGILRGLSVEYLRKARGLLTAECTCEVPAVAAPIDVRATATVRDLRGNEVARGVATWRLAPAR
jgi:acyl-coenzyme A thioesterase PaaI-like protein